MEIEMEYIAIREFDAYEPIARETDSVIVIGHTRLKAAQKLGSKTVQVAYADLPEDKVKAYRLADNKTGELAEWGTDLEWDTDLSFPSSLLALEMLEGR